MARSKESRHCVFDALLKMGYSHHLVNRSLMLYEKHYNVNIVGYDNPIITEIIFRISIKDKLKQSQTIYYSKVNLIQVLETFFQFLPEYINDAVKQYEQSKYKSEIIAYDIQDIIKLIMNLRAIDHQNSTEQSVTDIEIVLDTYSDAEIYYKNNIKSDFQEEDQRTNWKDLKSLRFQRPQQNEDTINESDNIQINYKHKPAYYNRIKLEMNDSDISSHSNDSKYEVSINTNLHQTKHPKNVSEAHKKSDGQVKGETDSLQGWELLKSDCNKLTSLFRYRHCILIWMPIMDIITDIMIIIVYFNSSKFELYIISFILCCVMWLSMRLQPAFVICRLNTGTWSDIFSSVTVWMVFVFYIPFIPPFVMLMRLMLERLGNKYTTFMKLVFSVTVAICGTICIEMIFALMIIIYPFTYLYYAIMAFLTFTGCSLRKDNVINLNDLFDEHYQEQTCEQSTIVLKLTDFGFIQFINQWENILECIPQLIVQIYAYMKYSEFIPLWLFGLSVSISVFNVMSVILKMFINGPTHWTYSWNIDKKKGCGCC
eukprot:245099_1